VTVIGAFYPLAWAAERSAAPGTDVVDLTPPGVEAHDTNLNATQVQQIHTAELILLLGYIGFQPQVEDAARESDGEVAELARGLDDRPSNEQGLSSDPHVWLDPVLMSTMTERIGTALERVDPAKRAVIARRNGAVIEELRTLDGAYRDGLRSCRFTTFVATHEAFGYLADRYGLHQLGLEGITPEAEPNAEDLRAAENAIRDGTAAPAVFYEGTADGERIGRSVASTLGVPALPLGTLEFEPRAGDYLTVMRANLRNLEQGLRCR
jgi:zinc transport system substrate-binding protein